MPTLQKLFHAMKEAGATGTTAKDAVSLQVNVGRPSLSQGQRQVDDLVNLLRNISSDEHVTQAQAFLKPARIRQEYIQNFSAGFLKKLRDAKYKPTARQLFDDFMYRQTAELLGVKGAWVANIEKVRTQVLSAGESDALIRVIKMNRLRVSSLLVEAFQDDPLSRFLIETKWLKAVALVEFREFNNEFNVMDPVQMSLGVLRGAELFGAYDHDELISTLTGISAQDLERLRSEFSSSKNGHRIVRYALYDPKTTPFEPADLEWFEIMSPRTIHIQLAPDRVGVLPLVLPKGAVLWQRRHIHRASIMADTMPGMENHLIQQVMENKLLEAHFLKKYAPGSMPDFVLLKDLKLKDNEDPRLVWQRLNEVFPQGWVMKSAFDLASENSIVTDSLDIDQVMKAYENGFVEYQQEILADYAGHDPEFVIYMIKKHPGYMGWKVKEVLKNIDIAFAQAKVKIVNELRVEILGGNVLGHGSTVDRYAYQDELEGKAPRPRLASRIMREAERFAQSVVDRLPPELKILPYAFDVARLADGSWTVIETNPGGNSGFLEENPASSRMLVEYLEKYPEYSKYFKGILSAEDQMKWINRHLEEFNMTVKRGFPGYEFKKNDIVDREFKPIEIESKKIRSACEKLLAS